MAESRDFMAGAQAGQDSGRTEPPGSSADFSMWAEGRATGLATSSAQAWLQRFGTAKITLQRQGGALDFLYPFVDREQDLLFGQLGVRRTNLLTDSYRTTINLGIGYRRFMDGLMVGGNAFLDTNPERGHRRLGVGAEVWTDYLKFSANGYLRQSGWKSSPDLDAYKERPASGFDFRLEGALPQIPQLGAKVMYEKFYGDEVGLFGQNDRQRNPSAWTLGASYTPVPAVSLLVERRFGQGGLSDTAIKVGLKYALGVPLARQLEAVAVGATRKLSAMRYDLVERNNEIVLEYQKEVGASIRLPDNLSGYPDVTVPFPVTVEGAAAGTYQVQWSGSAAPFVAPYSGSSSAQLTMPKYVVGGQNSYQLFASLVDRKGQKATSNVMNVSVNPFTVRVQGAKPHAKSDGVDSIRFTTSVKGVQAEGISGQPVEWTLGGAGTFRERSDTTDANGEAYAVVTSVTPGQAAVEALIGQTFTAGATGMFATNLLAITSLVSNPPTLIADGASKAQITAVVLDSAGMPVPEGTEVIWRADFGNLSGTSSKTDARGVATAGYTAPTAAGVAMLTASARGAADRTLEVPLTADSAGARVGVVVASKLEGLADGNDTVTFTATVSDTNGNLVGSGVNVAWSTDLGTLSTATSKTNSSSKASTIVTAPRAAGIARVMAKASPVDPGESSTVSFKVDPAVARVAQVTSSVTEAAANGMDTVILTATVQDSNGNSAGAGAQVTWVTDLGSFNGASTATSVSDPSGQASIVLMAPTVPGTAHVGAKASVNDPGKGGNVLFKADASTFRIKGLNASKPEGVADGVETIILTARVEDAHGNAAGAGAPVNWSTDLGSFGGVRSATSNSDASGIATIALTAPTTQGTAHVSAKASATDPGLVRAVPFKADASTFKVMVLDASKVVGTADGVDTITLTATVEDANGNSAGAGAKVSWSTTQGTFNGASAATSMSSANGTATIVLKAPTAAGIANVGAKASINDPGLVRALTFTADSNSYRVSILDVSKTEAVADGGDLVTLTATVKDAHGNLAGAGVQISWATNLGTFNGATAGASTADASGKASIVLKAPTTSGLATIRAYAGGGDAGKTQTIFFKPDASTYQVTVLGASKTEGLADGQDTITLTATVADANGNSAGAAAQVTWTTDVGSFNGASSAVSLSDANGVATVVLRAPTASGTAHVGAKASASDPGKVRLLQFKADASTYQISVLSANKLEAVADGLDVITLTASVVDAFGNAAGAGAQVSWGTDLGTLNGSRATTSATDASGVATVILVASISSGAAHIVAKASMSDPGKSKTVQFKANTATLRVSFLGASKPEAVADGVDTVTLSAVVEDANGNAAGAGVAVAWSTDLGGFNGAASASSLTDSNGEATIVLKTSTSAGIAHIRAKASSADSGEAKMIPFRADVRTFRVTGVSTSKTDGVANGLDTVALSAYVEDAQGNPAGSGTQVTWSTDLGTVNGAGATTSSTDSNGEARVVLQAPTSAGTAHISAKAGATDPGESATVTFKSDPSTYRVNVLSTNKATGAANSADIVTMLAAVTDSQGAPVGAGVQVNWVSTGGYLGSARSVTDANGVAANTMRSAWITDFRVTARASAADPGKAVDVTFVGPALNLTIDKSSIASSGVDFGTASVRVLWTDGKPFTGNVNVSIGPTLTDDLSRSYFSLRTDGSGLASFKYRSDDTDGSRASIRMTLTDFPNIGADVPVEVVPPRVTSVIASSVSGNPADGTPVLLRATLLHADGTPVANDVVLWNTNLGVIGGVSPFTDASGVSTRELSSWSDGTAQVTAFGARGGDRGQSLTIEFVPAP
ncbi:Ig-like domain-containing protein [Achromobacter sp.]|uniref:Ig-like domain-containing protein n=1 Tax=Achromobacter sp. TaxID=134375 RepID=UPI00257D23CB|nr:Ig-like domain-containing protein [Achromobacter sp.]